MDQTYSSSIRYDFLHVFGGIDRGRVIGTSRSELSESGDHQGERLGIDNVPVECVDLEE